MSGWGTFFYSQYQGSGILEELSNLPPIDVKSISVRKSAFGEEKALNEVPEEILLGFLNSLKNVEWAMGVRPPSRAQEVFLRVRSSAVSIDFKLYYRENKNEEVLFDLIRRSYHGRGSYTQSNYGSFKAKSLSNFLSYIVNTNKSKHSDLVK